MNDYAFEPREAPSIYLKLKKKGDAVLIRIVSPPYREPKVWRIEGGPPLSPAEAVKLTEKHWQAFYRDPDYNITEVFHWKVIDRNSGMVKIFSGTAGIYKQIKKFADTPGWGDPTAYDIVVERTEQPGPSYYTVTPMPDKTQLTAKERDLAETISMSEKMPAARRLSEAQIDHIPEMDEQSSPSDDEPQTGYEKAKAQADKLRADKVESPEIEDIGDEPFNLDNIPF